MRSTTVDVSTGTRHVTDLTGEATRWLRAEGIEGDGLLHVFAPHATAGVALMELGSGSERDLDEVVARLLPRDDRWAHQHGSTGHGSDHVLPVLIAPSLGVPVLGGRPALGTWQSLVLIDFNADNPRRQVRLSFLSG